MTARATGSPDWPPLLIVVGAGGVGKTTLAASLALRSSLAGAETLVMTFDPSLRLKDTLGVGEEARDREVRVEGPGAPGIPGTDAVGGAPLWTSLLDARRTFDRLVERYAPDPQARDRILTNPYYDSLAGSLAGILEYMAVERLWESWQSGKYQRIVLDTPPTRQALDFLEAPERIVGFLDSGALRLALKTWFDDDGRLKAASRWGRMGRSFEGWLDEVVGLDLLRDMSEFFRAFGPLFTGFRERALEVQALLRSPQTLFLLVAGPGEERNPDTLFFARRLRDSGHRVGPVVVNRVHPPLAPGAPAPAATAVSPTDGRQLLAWLGERDRRGVAALRQLLPPPQQVVDLPLLPSEPVDLPSLAALGAALNARLAGA